MFLPRLRLVRRKFISFKIAFILLLTCFILTLVFSSEYPLVTENKNWSVTGQFTINGTYPSDRSEIKSIVSRSKDIVLWGSWTGDDKHTGKLVSPAFKAPTILSLFVAGYPNASGNELFLERIDDRQRLMLKVVDPHEHWEDNKWLLPFSWRGTKIRLVAIDGATAPAGWLGVSSPRTTNWFSLLRFQIPSLVIYPIYILDFTFFLIPGIFLGTLLVQRNYISKAYTLILSIMISSIIGYTSFWIYFFNRDVGKAFSILITLVSIWYLRLFVKNKNFRFLGDADILVPSLIMFFVGLFYISILYLINFGQLPELISQVRFLISQLPPDNTIPMLFANRLYMGQDPRHLIGDWLSSDRPPLQAGLILVHRPLMALTGLDTVLHYQTLALIAQCSWVAAMWALCRTARLSGRRIALVMAFSIFSGFFLLNSVYVWPKLLAGSLTVFAFTLLLQPVLASRSPSTIEISLAAAAAALGMLAHGGVIFTLPAIVLIIMRKQYFPDIRRVLIGCAIFALLLAPWSAYQKLYEPPGDRLVKWHIGGVIPIDKRSALQTIIDSYQSQNLAEITNNKWENLKTLVGKSSSKVNLYETKRESEFFSVFPAINILNISWVILIINFCGKRLLPKIEEKAVKIILGVSFISLIVWVMVMFGPATTVIHQGSYATMILLFTGLGIVVASIPGWLPYFFLSLQILTFAVTWIFTTPLVRPNMLMFIPNIPISILAIVTFICVVKVLNNISQHSFAEE